MTDHFNLNNIPERSVKPRNSGLTMVMDKGISLREAEDFVSVAAKYVDIVKLGFGSGVVTPNLEEKIAVYRKADIAVYFGGTLLEAYIVRNQFDDYLKLIEKFKITHVEISDGSITLPHTQKCDYIKQLKKYAVVISEVGSKEEGIIIHPVKWIEMMQKELEAGVWKVIAEARESGTVGIYRPNGKAHVVLINKITAKVAPENIIWEAPLKSQQAYFIQHFGANVNLGNIAPNEVISLETLRLGLRSDTFFQFLDNGKPS
ncbi:MAG: phosphosulfolactate synthase [Bacteroidia bacterium]